MRVKCPAQEHNTMSPVFFMPCNILLVLLLFLLVCLFSEAHLVKKAGNGPNFGFLGLKLRQ